MSDFEALKRLAEGRWSCRAFLPDPVPRETVEEIIALAARVPTWNNTQPWELIVTGPEETARFREMLLREVPKAQPAPDFPFPSEYRGVYRQRRFDCAMQLYDAVGVARGDRAASARQTMRNYALFDAPHTAIVTTPAELGTYGAVDCGAFVAAFCLAAQARGVATIAQAALAAFAPLVRAHFDIPDERLIVCAVSFGHADPNHPVNAYRTPRAALEDYVEWRE